jgi:hypothetical protein
VCFVWISEQTATNALYSIDGIVSYNRRLFIYGLHNGTVNILGKLETSIDGMMSDDGWEMITDHS